jgi:hypothetical protein
MGEKSSTSKVDRVERRTFEIGDEHQLIGGLSMLGFLGWRARDR